MEVGSLSVPVKADLGPIERDLQALRQRLGQAETQTQGVTNAMQGMQRQTVGLTSALKPLAGALAGVFSVRALINFTDTWTDLTSRVNLAAGSIENGAAVMDQLQVVARRTYSSLQETTESYIRNAQTLRDLGRSTQETLDYTEALNNALVVSGARADRAASVQNALGQAMAAGSLRGQNLNTVIERGGRVAELLAEELGTTVSGLRQFGRDGKITGDVIDRALVGNLEKLREEAESMPATIGDAFQLIGNALLQTIGVFDSANEISGTLAESLIWVADNMRRLVTYVGTAAAGWAAYSTVIAAANAGLFTFNGLLAATRVALVRLGLGAIIVAAGELVYQFTRLVEGAGGFGEALEILGRVADGVWEGIKISAQAISPALQSVWLTIQADFTDMIRTLQLEWNSFLETFEAPALTATIGGRTYELIGGLDLSGWKADVREASEAAETLRGRAEALRNEAGELVNAGFDKAAESLGELVEVANRVREQADLSGDGGPNRVTPAVDPKAAREAERLRKAYEALVRDSRMFIEQQEIEARVIGMTDLEAAKLRNTFDLLNAAKRAGINLTEAQTEELTNLAHAMAEAEYQTNKLREAYEFNKDVFKGFFTDLKQSLQNGASIWEAFGNAAANALQKIADKALDLALNGIFDMIFGAFSGGLGGGGGGFFSRLFGFYENGTSFAPGGLAVVGERGPELVRLPGGAQVTPNNRVTAPMQASFGGGAGSSMQRVAVDISLSDDLRATVRQEASDVVEVAIRQYDKHTLPNSVTRVSEKPRHR